VWASAFPSSFPPPLVFFVRSKIRHPVLPRVISLACIPVSAARYLARCCSSAESIKAPENCFSHVAPGLVLFFLVLIIFSCVCCSTLCGLLQDLILVLLLSYWIKRLEDPCFKLLSCGDFINTPTRCSMK
jgi:hypothetical protein